MVMIDVITRLNHYIMIQVFLLCNPTLAAIFSPKKEKSFFFFFNFSICDILVWTTLLGSYMGMIWPIHSLTQRKHGTLFFYQQDRQQRTAKPEKSRKTKREKEPYLSEWHLFMLWEKVFIFTRLSSSYIMKDTCIILKIEIFLIV